jgi:hypothetical protein
MLLAPVMLHLQQAALQPTFFHKKSPEITRLWARAFVLSSRLTFCLL